ncbi:MAG: hypothetical protein ABIA75_00355 [Candidatus Neomarinimicrobiota bacterium]
MNRPLFTTYLGLRFRSLRNRILAQHWKRWVEIAVSLIILIGVEWGGYLLFRSAFRFLLGQGEIGQIILDRLFNMGWSVIFLLLIISNIITAFSTFYRSPEVEYLFSTNLSYGQIFRLKFLDSLLFSSWAIVLLGLPLILAYGAVRELTVASMLLLTIFGLPLLLWLAGITALLILLPLIRISGYIRLRTSFVILALALCGFFLLYRQFNQVDVVVAGDVADLRYLGRYLENLARQPFQLIPSYWFTHCFFMKAGDPSNLMLFGGLLVTTALLGWELLLAVVGRLYYGSWQLLQSRHRILTPAGQSQGKLFGRLKHLPARTRALYLKDLAQFSRTPQQWIQFLLFILMIMIYVLNLARIEYNLHSAGEFWRRLVFVLNFGFSGFVLASLITRFVFPLISLEGRNRWVLLASPVTMKQLLRQKFRLSATLFFVLAELVALLSGILLKQTAVMILISSILLLVMSVTLTSISLGLGAVFPLYHESNPMRIVSGLGGIIAILVSLAYLGLMILALIWLTGFYYAGHYGPVFWTLIFVMLLVNALANYVSLNLGYRALCRAVG